MNAVEEENTDPKTLDLGRKRIGGGFGKVSEGSSGKSSGSKPSNVSVVSPPLSIPELKARSSDMSTQNIQTVVFQAALIAFAILGIALVLVTYDVWSTVTSLRENQAVMRVEIAGQMSTISSQVATLVVNDGKRWVRLRKLERGQTMIVSKINEHHVLDPLSLPLVE